MTLPVRKVLIVHPVVCLATTVERYGGTKAKLGRTAVFLGKISLRHVEAAEKLVHAYGSRQKIGPCYGTFASPFFAVIFLS